MSGANEKGDMSDEMEQLKAQCAAMREALSKMPCTCDTPHSEGHYDYCAKQIANEALSTDAGRDDYVAKSKVKPLVEALVSLHAGSICTDPATSAASRKDCYVCQALANAKELGL